MGPEEEALGLGVRPQLEAAESWEWVGAAEDEAEQNLGACWVRWWQWENQKRHPGGLTLEQSDGPQRTSEDLSGT